MLLPKIIQNIITLKSSPNGGLFCAFSGWQITADQDLERLFAPLQAKEATAVRLRLQLRQTANRVAPAARRQ